MISNLDPQSALFLANVDRIQQRIADANNQISSGKKINVASDAPDQVEPLLQLRADRQLNAQITSNLTLAQTDASAADDALGSAVQVLDRAITLAAQGANFATDAAGRQSIAQEIQALQQQMVASSQTQVQGRYVFGGDRPGSSPYQLDLNAARGVDQLTASAATRQIEDPAGGSFTASKTAQEIFDPLNADGTAASDNVFAALNNLRVALLANDQAGVTNSTSALHLASDRLNDMQAFYGSVENRIDAATTFASKYDTQLQTELSQKEDSDAASAAMEMTQANTQLQAAFQMRSMVPTKSLFDFLA